MKIRMLINNNIDNYVAPQNAPQNEKQIAKLPTWPPPKYEIDPSFW